MKRWLDSLLPPIVVFAGLTLAAEWYIGWRQIPEYLVPQPSAVWRAMIEQQQTLLEALGYTTQAALIGFAASAIAGVLIAIGLSSARLIRNAFYPYTVFFQTVPVVAIAPLLVIWFGAGLTSVAICAFVVSVFPVIANTLAGLMSTDPALRDLFRLYHAGPVARLIKLRLPWALPNVLTGLRIAAGLSVIGTIVGEFVAGDFSTPGLGVIIVAAAKMGSADQVFAGILVASLLGVAMLSLLNVASFLLLRHWHASEKN